MHADVWHWHVNTHSWQHQDSHCSHHCCQLLSKSVMNNTLWIIILPSIFQCPTAAYLPSSLMITTTLADLLNNLLHKVNLYKFSLYLLLPNRNMWATAHIMCHPSWGQCELLPSSNPSGGCQGGKGCCSRMYPQQMLASLNYTLARVTAILLDIQGQTPS